MTTPVQAPTTGQGALYDMAARHARALEAGTQQAVDDVTAAWAEAYRASRKELDALFSRMEAARAAGVEVNPAWLQQAGRVQAVVDVAAQRLAEFGTRAAGTVKVAQRSAIAQGVEHAAGLGVTAMATGLPGVSSAFADVNPAVLDGLVGRLSNGTPLARLITATGKEASLALRAALVQGVSLGWSIKRMSRLVDKAMNLPRHRATTILRTEVLRCYREASRETYRANPDVLAGWVWRAALDSRTCAACAVMDGTFHDLDERLDGHPRCRCAMVPEVRPLADVLGIDAPDRRPPVRQGREWLLAQPLPVLRAMLGPGKAAALKAGKITPEDLVAQTSSDDWGSMRRERSLVEIRERRNAAPALVDANAVRANR